MVNKVCEKERYFSLNQKEFLILAAGFLPTNFSDKLNIRKSSNFSKITFRNRMNSMTGKILLFVERQTQLRKDLKTSVAVSFYSVIINFSPN